MEEEKWRQDKRLVCDYVYVWCEHLVGGCVANSWSIESIKCTQHNHHQQQQQKENTKYQTIPENGALSERTGCSAQTDRWNAMRIRIRLRSIRIERGKNAQMYFLFKSFYNCLFPSVGCYFSLPLLLQPLLTEKEMNVEIRKKGQQILCRPSTSRLDTWESMSA